MRILSSLPVIAAIACLAGCDSQADPSYQGEPLATIRGQISAAPDPSGEVDARLLWHTFEPSDSTVLGTSVPVNGSFPANFTMPIYEPPPEAALVSEADLGLSRFGIAYIALVSAGASIDDLITSGPCDDGTSCGAMPCECEVRSPAVLGVAHDFVLVYVGDAMVPGDYVEKVFGGVLAPGYHLLAVDYPGTNAEVQACYKGQFDASQAYAACVELCAAIADPTQEQACVDACPVPDDTDCGEMKHDTFHTSRGGFTNTVSIAVDPNWTIPEWF